MPVRSVKAVSTQIIPEIETSKFTKHDKRTSDGDPNDCLNSVAGIATYEMSNPPVVSRRQIAVCLTKLSTNLECDLKQGQSMVHGCWIVESQNP